MLVRTMTGRLFRPMTRRSARKLGDEEFALAPEFDRIGKLALAGWGVEPGMADWLCRYAADHLFDEIDEIGIRDGANLEIAEEVGKDNIFHKERYKVNLDLTAINFTNKYALYNFLSTFSGTHYVSPRAITAQLGFHF